MLGGFERGNPDRGWHCGDASLIGEFWQLKGPALSGDIADPPPDPSFLYRGWDSGVAGCSSRLSRSGSKVFCLFGLFCFSRRMGRLCLCGKQTGWNNRIFRSLLGYAFQQLGWGRVWVTGCVRPGSCAYSPFFLSFVMWRAVTYLVNAQEGTLGVVSLADSTC